MIYVNAGPAIAKLRAISKELSPQNFNRATSRSLNETILQGRTQARTSVKALYNIPQKNLAGVNVEKSTSTSLMAKLYANATPIPMDAFSPVFHTATHTIAVTKKGAQKIRGAKKKQTVGQGVSITVLKSQPNQYIPYAFMIKGAKPRVFARGEYKTGNAYGFIQRHKRLNAHGNDIPIKPLLSVTIHAAVINKKALQAIEKKVSEVFPTILSRNVAYLLTPLGP